MKTSQNLPLEIMREMTPQRVELPIINCAKPSKSAKQMTADQVAEVLLKQEVEWTHKATER